MKLFKQLFLALAFSFPLLSFATTGGWSSGGGELLKDSRNPWFLNNTEEVGYCLQIDEKNFGAPLANVRQQIERAFQFWRGQFQVVPLINLKTYGHLKIATQKFSEVPCGTNARITFQFGKLTEQQRRFLKNPSKYAAISVRTGYDEKTLAARGFVYVSASRGPLAYDPKGTVANAWALNGGELLYQTLLHELGHVFGIPHFGTYGDLMSEGYVESLLAKHYAPVTVSNITSGFFSLPLGTEMMCPAPEILERWQNFFMISPSKKCFQLELVHEVNNPLFGETTARVFVKEDSGERTLITESKLVMDWYFPYFYSMIGLPENQGVFARSDLEEKLGNNILGIVLLSLGKSGLIQTPANAEARGLRVRFDQGKRLFTVEGLQGGKAIQLL